MSDEGFREIQLNGKQLIFMFMAVTVVLDDSDPEGEPA